MPPFPTLRKALIAVGAGGLIAAALTAPAAAEHPEYAPTPFYNSVEGEDGCTLFETTGEASWPAVHPPEPVHVAISGTAVISGPVTGRPCLPVIPFDRQIEFTGHVNDWPAVEHVIPMPVDSPEFEYELALEGPGGAEIEYVTMRICQERRADGSHWPDRCGPKITIEQVAAPEPTEYCEFTAAITSTWGSGFIGQVTITAIEPISDWHVIVTFPGDQTLSQVWNAVAAQTGSNVTITPAAWNGQIPGGETVIFGFVVIGPSHPPPHIEVWADGHRCAEV